MNSLYCTQLTTDTKNELSLRLQSYRKSKIKEIINSLKNHSQDFQATLNRDWSNTVDLLTRDFLKLFFVNASKASEICNHWSTILVLELLVDEFRNLRRSYRIQCLITCLSAIMIEVRISNSSVIYENANYRTIDSIYCFFSGQEIINSNGTKFSQELIWCFNKNKVTIYSEVSGNQVGEFSIPLKEGFPGAPIQIVPLTKLVTFDSVSIDGDNPLSKGYHFDEILEGVEPADWKPVPISKSVDAVYPLLEQFWPETIDWLKILVPAFVDRAGIAYRNKANSYTWGPGTPIFLSKVENPLYHASVIIHELQHQRYLLFTNLDDFLILNTSEMLFISPWRDDPRPLFGLVLGLHAFLAENAFRSRILPYFDSISDDLSDKMFSDHRKNLFAFRTILDFEPKMSLTEKQLFLEMTHKLLEQHKLIEPQASVTQRIHFDAWLDGHINSVCSLSQKLVNTSEYYKNWEETNRIAAEYVSDNGGCKCE